MPLIQQLLQRWGFVKLGRYGLVRTADDRIVSTRPAVLDDGTGSRVVGWRDEDLAMAELTPWGRDADGARGAPEERPELPDRGPRRPQSATLAGIAAPPRAALPVIPLASVSIPAAGTVASGAVMPVEVEPESSVDEDDWEWTIALARARAAAEDEVPQAAPQALVPAQAQPARMTQVTPPPAQPIEAPPQKPALPLLSAPDPRIAPATVIPVPPLPSIRDQAGASRLEPVVRTHPGQLASPGRFPKGTSPISDTEQTPASLPDDTELTFAVGDRTKPGVAMPPAARTVALPSIKRPSQRG